MRVATSVWTIGPELVLALDEHLGPPVDSYVNGSQTWLTEGAITLEWRLHPVSGYDVPGGLSHYDVWETVVGALSAGALAFLAAARTVPPHDVGTVQAGARALRELEGVHRALIATHLEKPLKSDRVLRELRRVDS